MTADDKTDLLLDILIHDINNANTISLGYSSILEYKLTGEDLTYLQNIAAGIKQSVDLIKNAQMIRRIQKTPVILSPLSLGDAVKRIPINFSGLPVEVSGTAGTIETDEFLDEAFRLIVENSFKHGGKNVKVTVRAEDLGDRWQVSVEDTGTGIPDSMKDGIFNRLVRDAAQKKGRKGLGLILARLILERYSAGIRAEDRVPGQYSQGAAIRMVFKKSQG